MRVDVIHPAHVRSVPLRGRTSRDVLARVATPVDLPVAERDSLRHLGSIRVFPHSDGWANPNGHVKAASIPVREHGGMAYAPMQYTDAYAGPNPVQLRSFLNYLRGDLLRSSHLDALVDAFHATPVQDLKGYPALHGGHEDGRGMPFDEDRQREISVDGRAAAGAAVTRFLGAEILVVPGEPSGEVWKRVRPTVRHIRPDTWVAFEPGRPNALWDCPAFALDRLDEAADHGRAREVPPALREVVDAALALHPTLAGDDEDMRLAVASVAGSSARWLHGAARDGAGDPAETAARVEGLARHHFALRTGALPDADLPEALAEIRRGVAYIQATTQPKGAHRERVAAALGLIDGHLAPRLAARAPVDERDMESLSGLIP